MVYFMFVLKFDKGYGNNKEISISKIKNKIITKKNCIEKDGMTGVWVMKPHSKVFHFCKVISISIAIALISAIMTLTSSMLIITSIVIVIWN